MMARFVRRALLAAALLVGAAADLRAQDPVPRDTTRTDSTAISIPGEAVRGDTLPDRTPQSDTVPPDSTIPAPNFPLFPEMRQTGFSAGVWVFGTEELGRFHGLSMLELLDRIPGLVISREGGLGRPAGVSSFGGGGGRLRVFMDGWELTALGASVPELQRIPLGDVVEIRVTRGLAETRIDVQTLRPSDRRPFAQIEGGEGDFNTRILRGLFSRPIGPRVQATVGIDVVESRGFRAAEPFSENTGFARLSYAFSPERGIQLDYRSTAIDASRTLRPSGELPAEAYDRGEVMLRARGRFFGGVWLDGAVGRGWQTPAGADTVSLEREAVQAYARGAVDLPFGRVIGAARWRQADREGYTASGTELSARAELTPGRLLAAWGEVRATRWGGVTGLELEAQARAAWRGVTLFGGVATGNRGVRYWRDTSEVVRNLAHLLDPEVQELDTLPVVRFLDQDALLASLRAGAEIERGTIRAGAALVAHDLDAFVPYGFPYDRGLLPTGSTTVSGIEAYASVPVLLRQFRLDASYTDFFSQPARPYTPVRFGRAALEYHWIFRGGNLEPTIRAEVVARGPAAVINPESGAFDLASEPYAIMNLFVQVRVLDVRAFWRLENVLNRETGVDVAPGLTLPGQRALFGVRWFFRD